jgi:periplasmic protein TonB
MGSAATQLTVEAAAIGGGHDGSRTAADDRRFFRFLLLALVLHALVLIRVQTAEPRRLGAPQGADDGISVSIITEQDLKGRATVEDRAAGAPAPPAPPAKSVTPPPTPPPAPPIEQPTPPEPQAAAPPPPPPPPAEEPTPVEKPTPPAELRPTLPDQAVEPAPKAPDPKPTPQKSEAEKAQEQPSKTEKTEEAAKPVEKPVPEKLKPAEKPAEAKPKAPAPEKKPAPKTETAKLDLTPPAIFQAPVGGGGAGVQRPAGITRSGENDDFARNVIRALQSTMPQLSNTFGRVTVRIELNMNGNLVRTTVVKPSSVAGLDQSVVFATQQSSFPFPPRNAVPADLVFFVTYIYR